MFLPLFKVACSGSLVLLLFVFSLGQVVEALHPIEEQCKQDHHSHQNQTFHESHAQGDHLCLHLVKLAPELTSPSIVSLSFQADRPAESTPIAPFLRLLTPSLRAPPAHQN